MVGWVVLMMAGKHWVVVGALGSKVAGHSEGGAKETMGAGKVAVGAWGVGEACLQLNL